MSTKTDTPEQHTILHQLWAPPFCCLCIAEARIRELEEKVRELEEKVRILAVTGATKSTTGFLLDDKIDVGNPTPQGGD